jgi:hypothetical protein
MFHMHKKLISLKLCTNLFTSLLVRMFSYTKIIHQTDRCLLIKQHDHYTCAPLLGDSKSSKTCSFVTQHNATDFSSFEGVCNRQLTTGMSTEWLPEN